MTEIFINSSLPTSEDNLHYFPPAPLFPRDEKHNHVLLFFPEFPGKQLIFEKVLEIYMNCSLYSLSYIHS